MAGIEIVDTALREKFIKDQNGNIGMIFAIVLVPLLLTIGVAVDMSRISSFQTKMQDTADAAALDASLAYMLEGNQAMRESGRVSFTTHADTIENLSYTLPIIEKTDQNSVTVSSTGSFTPIFPQLFGYPKLDFNVVSEASLAEPEGLEITIAFDNTNSMDFGSRWQTSITTIQNTLEAMQSLSGRDNFYLTLLPFADTVNIGQSNSRWTDGPIPSGWLGCVEPRRQATRVVDDHAPRSEPFTPAVPYQKFEFSEFTIGCPVVEITGPTNSVSRVVNATSRMRPGGTGRFDVGMAWAWRTLSPNWRGEWRVNNYPSTNISTARNENRKKKIIFVTDGNSDASLGDYNERSWEHNQGSEGYFEQFVELCNSVKAEGIEIYMVNIVGNPHAVDYFKQCATSLNHYYYVDDISDLRLPIDDIKNELLSELRIIR